LVEWRHIPGFAPYPETLAAMNAGTAGEAIRLLEHPPLYAADIA
jgi:lipoyl(octanoyl) transferase